MQASASARRAAGEASTDTTAASRGRRLRVAHVITLLELGGAQQNTLHTVRHLDRSRFDVTLVAGKGGLLDDEAHAIPELRTHFLSELVREVKPLSDLAAYRALVRVFRAERPDVVHTHSSKAGILGRWAAHAAGVPFVVHSVHGFGFTPGQSPPLRAAFFLAEKWTTPVTHAFVTVSHANLTQGVRSGLFRRGQVRLIRSGIPLGEFAATPVDRDGVRRELGLEPGTPLVGTIACLKPQKDPFTFAETVAGIHREAPAARFYLAGDGELRAALEERLGALGLGDVVRLLGWRRDVARLLRASDLLLHTSRWEGLPRVLPQAMAAGVPVVATAVDGAPEAVREGENGFLVPPGDAAGLADAVLRLLRDPELGRRMGRRGRELVAEFDVVHLVPAQELLYEDLVRGNAGCVAAEAAA